MDINLTGYLLTLGCSAAACILWFFLSWRRQPQPNKAAALSGLIFVLGTVLGILCARLAWMLIRINALRLPQDLLTLRYDRMPPYKKDKLTLMQASLTYKDPRFSGYDAACVVEVIEHLDPQRISAFERVLFEFAAPNTVIVTTPNKEYNAHYEWLSEGNLRHCDHRFEWGRDEFRQWTEHVCGKYGYTCEISGIGDTDEEHGQPTQMGVFTRNG